SDSGTPSTSTRKCVQSGSSASFMVAPVPSVPEKTPARYVTGEDGLAPSASEPRVPTQPLATVKMDSIPGSHPGSYPASTRVQLGSMANGGLADKNGAAAFAPS